MVATPLAEALRVSRRPNGDIRLEELMSRLTKAGLAEYSRAAVTLASRATSGEAIWSDDPHHPWV